MLAAIPSATLLGVDGLPVRVEVHVAQGLPGFTIVGLPDAACREARDRVRAAVLSSGFKWPQKKITVNLAPSALRKTGAGLDLPIALGVLAAAGDVSLEQIEGLGLIGELGLDGRVRRVPGVVCMAPAVDAPVLVVPAECYAEAAVDSRRHVRAVTHLAELVAAVRADSAWPDPPQVPAADAGDPPPDMADIRGQQLGRMAIEIAAAGAHHTLLLGPPGAGKTMLARRIIGLLPDLATEQAIQNHPRALCGRVAIARIGFGHAAAFPGAAPHRVDNRRRRWWRGSAAARRDQLCHRWRLVPRRAG